MIFMCFVCIEVGMEGRKKECTREGTPLENIHKRGCAVLLLNVELVDTYVVVCLAWA